MEEKRANISLRGVDLLSFLGSQDANLRRLIVVETQAYWAAIAAGDWQGAYARFTDDYQERVPFATWRRQRRDAGGATPVITEIRWSQAAQRHHGLELYAIVNWTARKAAAGSTGTLIWRQGPSGGFRLENTKVRVLIRPRN